MGKKNDRPLRIYSYYYFIFFSIEVVPVPQLAAPRKYIETGVHIAPHACNAMHRKTN